MPCFALSWRRAIGALLLSGRRLEGTSVFRSVGSEVRFVGLSLVAGTLTRSPFLTCDCYFKRIAICVSAAPHFISRSDSLGLSRPLAALPKVFQRHT